MKELIRFRQFLTEGKINEERKGQDKLDALEAALTDQHAKNVISSGRFTTIDTFGNGEDVTPLKNVTKELEKELEYLKNNDMVDTDEYDDASDDLKAAQEIAQVVKKMGGKIAYGGDGLMYVYSVNSEGDLLGQAVAEGQINENLSQNLIKVYEDEIESLMASDEDDVVPALRMGIALLQRGEDPSKVNMATAKKVAQIQGEFDFDEFARIYMDKAQG